MHSMLQKPPAISFLQFYSAAQEVVKQSPHYLGGQQYGADAALLNTRVNAHLVHILLDMCLFSPSACPGLLLNSMLHY